MHDTNLNLHILHMFKDTFSLGLLICYYTYIYLTLYNFLSKIYTSLFCYLLMCLNSVGCLDELGNSEDPDQISHCVASDLCTVLRPVCLTTYNK